MPVPSRDHDSVRLVEEDVEDDITIVKHEGRGFHERKSVKREAKDMIENKLVLLLVLCISVLVALGIIAGSLQTRGL